MARHHITDCVSFDPTLLAFFTSPGDAWDVVLRAHRCGHVFRILSTIRELATGELPGRHRAGGGRVPEVQGDQEASRPPHQGLIDVATTKRSDGFNFVSFLLVRSGFCSPTERKFAQYPPPRPPPGVLQVNAARNSCLLPLWCLFLVFLSAFQCHGTIGCPFPLTLGGSLDLRRRLEQTGQRRQDDDTCALLCVCVCVFCVLTCSVN